MAYIKKKKDNSYLITVSCGRNSQDKKITRSTTFHPDLFTAKGHQKSPATIEKEVAAFAANYEKQILTGKILEGSSMTLEEYSEKYLHEYAEMYQAPRTLQNTKAAIKQFNTDFGYMMLDTINPLFLQEYVNKLQTAKRTDGKPGTLSNSTIRRRMAVLSAMLSQAVRWNLISYNPMDRVQLRQQETSEKKIMCFTQEQAETFLAALDNPLLYRYSGRQRSNSSGKVYPVQEYQAEHSVHTQLKLFFYLAMFTGCRRGELIALTWPDIDLENGTISITKSTCRVNGKVITKETKTKGSVRKISIPSPVLDLVRTWKTEQGRHRLMIGSKWQGNDFVFIQWNGLQMGLETPYHAFKRIIDNYNSNKKENDIELPQIPLHGLRHTAATLLISQGVDVRTVSGRLGHANTSTTLNIYAEFLNEMDRKASDALESLLLKQG